MASPSYFDLPPQSKATGADAALQENEAGGWTRTGLLSPQVTQILDELGLEDQSSSSSEEDSLSEEEIQPINSAKDAQHHDHKDEKRATNTKKDTSPSQPPRKPASTSPSKLNPGHVSKTASHPRIGDKSIPAKHPRMARFHSLRSMLFSSNIEQNFKKAQKEECMREEVASKWRDQHAQRQMSKPKTPENELTPKDGLSRKITTRIRRMTSREMPIMGRIKEGEDDDREGHESTASSENEDEGTRFVRKHREGEEESIDHSDLDDLVRWVSRRDPPSDGEAQKGAKLDLAERDSAHESLGDSDVDELVRWTSRKPKIDEKEQAHSEQAHSEQSHSGYSDASTEEDSEANNGSSDDEDADELVRWISRREGAEAGPVWQKANSNTGSGHATPRHLNEHSPEPTRGRRKEKSPERTTNRHSAHDNDMNEPLHWISRNDSKH